MANPRRLRQLIQDTGFAIRLAAISIHGEQPYARPSEAREREMKQP